MKVGSVRSEWMTVRKGAPQGSILGPFIFNLFQNDLIVKLERTSDIYITMLITTQQVLLLKILMAYSMY